MGNNIELAKKYIPLLDEKYKIASKTSFLNINSALVLETAMANTMLIPKMTVTGLKDYSKANGFGSGDTTIEWVAYTFTRDRGVTFSVDKFDNQEVFELAVGALANELITTEVSPESDCYKIKKMFDNAGTKTQETLDFDNVLAAIDAGLLALDEAGVSEENRVMFVSNAVYGLMKSNSDLNRKLDVQTGLLNVERRIQTLDGMPIIKMPAAMMKSNYTFTTGFAPAVGAKDINFIILDRAAVNGIVKASDFRMFDASTNQTANAYKIDYRLYEECFILDNKKDGIYISHKA